MKSRWALFALTCGIAACHNLELVSHMIENPLSTEFYSHGSTVNEILSLSTEVRELSSALGKVTERHKKAMESFGWFFDRELREKVWSIEHEVGTLSRQIEGLNVEVDQLMKTLKPGYGVMSRLFLVDALTFFPDTLFVLQDRISAAIDMGLLTFVIGGPLVLLCFRGVVSMFGSILAIAIGAGPLISSIIWLSHLPFIMIDYNPNIFEFLMIYIPNVLVFGGATLSILRITRRLQHLGDKEISRHLHLD